MCEGIEEDIFGFRELAQLNLISCRWWSLLSLENLPTHGRNIGRFQEARAVRRKPQNFIKFSQVQILQMAMGAAFGRLPGELGVF